MRTLKDIERRLDTLVRLQCQVLARGEDTNTSQFKAWVREENALEKILIQATS